MLLSETGQEQGLLQLIIWNYMNDSFRTDVFVRCTPESIACACIYMAARQLQIPLPIHPTWFGCFGVTEADINDICLTILQLYARRKPNPEKLEAVVNDARKLHVEAKLKAKGLTSSDVGTPNSTSRAASPATKLTISPINIPGMRRIKSEDEFSGNSGGNSYGNHVSKKKRRSHSQSRSRSRSKSRSYGSSRDSRSHSRSTSRSPKRKYRSPARKYKKESHISRSRSKDHYIKEKHHKRRHSPTYANSRSRSFSRTPDRPRQHKKYHKEKVKYRSRSKSRERSYKSKKHSNGHNRSRSRERYRR